MNTGIVTVQQIAMTRPTKEFIYTPSRPPVQICQAEFLEKYADDPHVIQVSFANDGISDPQPLTAYGNGLDCYYIVV